ESIMKNAVLNFVLTFLLLGAVLHVGAQTEALTNPYLVYFDENISALVIERADASERHLIGQGLIPETANEMENFGVLPSGEWLYWVSTTRDSSGTITAAQPFAVNVNGERVTALDGVSSGWVWG